MVYEYRCTKCAHVFDVVKSVKDFERNENCDKCGEFAERQFVANPAIFPKLSGMVEEAQYNPAFGKVIKNKRHRKYEAEKRGWVEVGNDYTSGDSMQKHFDTEREKKRERSWEDL